MKKEINIMSLGQYIKSIVFEHKITREELLKLGTVGEQREFQLAPSVNKLSNDE